MRSAELTVPAGVLNNAQGVLITGGHFIVNNAARGTFEPLLARVEPSAYAQKINTPRCFPSTRRNILDSFINRITLDMHECFWLAWLYGAAGAGKTAISRTIYDLCISRGISVASFFFSRLNPSRSTIDPLVATLAYQIIRLIPSVKTFVTQAIQDNPLIFRQPCDSQIGELVVEPLLRLHETGEIFKLLLLIDGLDECEGEMNQVNLITTLGRLLSSKRLPVYVLISSRSEYHLRMAFNASDLAPHIYHISLDDHHVFHPNGDILTYLNDSILTIRRTHPLAHCLGPDWPPAYHIQNIVEKASGQFIYAAVVVKFLSQPNASPASQLDIIAGLLPSTGPFTPFAELDALYCHIFSTVPNLATTMEFLSYILLTNEDDPAGRISAFFNVRPDTVFATFASLASVVDCGPSRFRFLHASLRDFLTDKTRSLDYYIDRDTWSTQYAIFWYQAHSLKASVCEDILQFLKYARPVNQLKACILKFNPAEHPAFTSERVGEYFTALRDLESRTPTTADVFRLSSPFALR